MYAKVKLANAHSYVLNVNSGISFTPKKMISFKSNLSPDPTYYFGNDIIENLADLLGMDNYDKVFFITTQVLDNLYGTEITGVLAGSGITCETVIIRDGEAERDFTAVDALCTELAGKGATKESILVGFGGGSLCDIVGFTAAMMLRGLRYVAMPASFMAATDGCLSNKQAVNGKLGKNQYTTFYAPHFIFCDTKYLQSESITGRKAALAEGIKNAFINNASLLYYYDEVLEKADLANLDHLTLSGLVFNVICSKLDILKKDPTEKRFATALEYGHTFGYVIEFLSGGNVPHGFAVAQGMCIAAELSRRMGYLSHEDVDRHFHFFGDMLGIDLRIPKPMTADGIMEMVYADSKMAVKGVRYVILERLGRCLECDGDYRTAVSRGLVHAVLREYNGLVERKTRKEVPFYDESVLQCGSPA